MHKYFYASGFIYHSPTNKILLQKQKGNSEETLVFFCKKSLKGTEPQLAFSYSVKDAIGISLSDSSIYPVYDYTHPKLGEQFIFFSDTLDITPETHPTNDKMEWIQLSKLSKHTMSEKTRHDIVIGERVINLKLSDARKTKEVQLQ